MKILVFELVICVVVISYVHSGTIHAQPRQTHKLVCPNTNPGDYYGRVTAISGTTMIVGLKGNKLETDDRFTGGSVFVYLSDTGKQTLQIRVPGAWEIGKSVAVSGTIAVVGAGGNKDTRARLGVAYLFDCATGKQLAVLKPDDGAPGDTFGEAVAIDGDIVVVGAPRDDEVGINSGSLYIFDAKTGKQIRKIIAPPHTLANTAVEYWFGSSIAIDGQVAIIGVTNDMDGGFYAGAAYLYDVTTGNQLAKLIASDAAMEDWFGCSVDISGDVAIVGAPWDDEAGSKSGSVYLFDVKTGKQISKLTAEDVAKGDEFGRSVAIYGDIAVVGSFLDNGEYDGQMDDCGSAYLFDVKTGKQLAKFRANDASANSKYGWVVAIDGTTVIVSAPDDHEYAKSSAGAVYVIEIGQRP